MCEVEVTWRNEGGISLEVRDTGTGCAEPEQMFAPFAVEACILLSLRR